MPSGLESGDDTDLPLVAEFGTMSLGITVRNYCSLCCGSFYGIININRFTLLSSISLYQNPNLTLKMTLWVAI
jgi:hypothetical protein